MGYTPGETQSTNLDELVTAVATRLMGIDSTTLTTATESVLRLLVEYFEVDLSFLRFHDFGRRSTVLIAEWPRRTSVPEPDPLGEIFFETAEPAFAASEHLADVLIVRPDQDSGYQERVRQGSGVEATSLASVPLRVGSTTTGTLGFVKFGDRGWDEDETRALRTIATLLAQLQGRLLAEDRLRHIAHHDELTGLPNRRALITHLQAVLDGPVPRRHALLFVDVDRLKAMNDFLGHEAGDRFIVEIAGRLRNAVRPSDMVARLGGDEFVVSIGGIVDEQSALAVAARVQRAVAEPIRLGGQSLARTVSVGIAPADLHVTTVSEWLRNADQAVLTAKERGGDTVVCFTAQMQAGEQLRVAVEMNLAQAIENDALAVHYQPLVDLHTRTVVGVEALLRWHDASLGAVSPELAVAVAEATNLAGQLGRWVLDEACRQFAQWRSELSPGTLADDFTVAVNISPVQLIAIDFVDTVARALTTYRMNGENLVLEVTEHAVVRDVSAALTTMHALRDLGVTIAIDDFGTGYSSLAQLKALPVNILKIDRGFVRDLGRTADDLTIVRSIVGLAQSFDLQLVAEGVETEVAASTLVEMGCRVAQGHLFSRPVPPERIPDLLAGRATLELTAPQNELVAPEPHPDAELVRRPSAGRVPRMRR